MTLPSSESAPSQVKPSGTGATAEEQEMAARWIVAFLTCHGVECAVTYEEPENCTCSWNFFHRRVSERLTRLVTAAKREGAIEAEKALDAWTNHDVECRYEDPPSRKFICVCGLTDALSALREQGGGR